MVKNYLPKLFPVLLILLVFLAMSIATMSQGATDSSDIDNVLLMTGVKAWQDAGWTGLGQTIGILDQGFDGIEEFQSNNHIQVQLRDHNSENMATNNHGTLVLELIHDVAPKADLKACQYASFDEYVDCINWFIAEDVNIINHSAGVAALPLDGTNAWAREAARATDAGILWVNAAGNFNGGLIDDDFFSRDYSGYHEFRATGTDTLHVDPTYLGQTVVTLSWEDSRDYPANAIDFELDVIPQSSDMIVSDAPQTGEASDQALEVVNFNASGPYDIRIHNIDGQGDRVHFLLFISFAQVEGSASIGSIIAPADFRNVLTVGAIEDNSIAPYSSRGQAAGALKPDMVAIGRIDFKNGDVFFGTSASAPLVAGTAALVWEANPQFSREEIFDYMRGVATQDDSIVSGPDINYGFGYMFIREPDTTPQPVQPSPVVNPTATPTLAPEQEDPGVVINSPNTDLRKGPGVRYDNVGHASPGDYFKVTGQADGNNWYEVDHPDYGPVWVPASNANLVNAKKGDIPAASSIPPVPTAEMPINTPNPFGSSATNGTTISSDEILNEVDPEVVPEGFGITMIDAYAANWILGQRTIVRSQPSVESPAVGSIACQIVHLVAQSSAIKGYVWYRVETGGWVRQDVIARYNTYADAQKAAATLSSGTSCQPPTDIPPTEVPATAVPGSNPPPQNPSHSQQVVKYSITIKNNSTCTLSGNLGGVHFNVASGQSQVIQVPAGNRTLSGSGSCGTVGPSKYNINGPAMITIG